MQAPILSLRHYGPSRGSHAHAHFQLLWTLEGEFELEVAGRGQRLRSGQGWLIGPDERHDFEAPQGSHCLVLDSLDAGWLGRACQPQHREPVDHLVRFLAEALRLGLPITSEYGALLLAQAWGPGERTPRPQREIDWLALRRWVLCHLAAPLTAADLAARVRLGESQFRTRCLIANGCAPMQWVRRLRLEQALALRAGGLGVADAARRVGYDSPSALTAALRRQAQAGRVVVSGSAAPAAVASIPSFPTTTEIADEPDQS